VKVRQPFRRGPKRSLLMNVLNATIPTHAASGSRNEGRPGKRPKSKFLAWGQQSPLCLWVIFFDWGRSKIKVKSVAS